MQKLTGGLVIATALCMCAIRSLSGQQILLLKQERDGLPAQNLTAAEFSTLGDPFFELVLKEHADVTNLARIEDLLQPNTANRQTFVVDENIRIASRPQQRRAVLTYSGTNRGLVLDTNVMASVAFSSEDFPEAHRFIEVWGWDNARGRYNYYKLDRTGTPDQRLSWKFRGSSVEADLLSPADREGTCMACHVNGGPVMKELAIPWNNWHSFESVATYLTQAASPNAQWPVAKNPRIAGRLQGAENLEVGGILPSITQFNNRRINQVLARSDADGNLAIQNGRATVLDGPRLLRPLFETTEVNLISARQKSGLHPSPAPSGAGPSQEVVIPATFFLNVNIIAGGTPAQFVGLGISAAQDFRNISLSAVEYKDRVIGNSLSLMGKEPADADFSWFTPEPSHIDNDMVDRLMRRGIVSKEFVAAVLAVDLENPVFSESRASLWRFIPRTFTFQPVVAGSNTISKHPDELTTLVIAALKAANVAANSPEGQFLNALQNPSPVNFLEQQVRNYHQRVSSQMQGPQTRSMELDRLFRSLLQRRSVFLRHETLGTLDETGNRLMPIPSNAEGKPATGSGGQVQ